MEKEEIKNKMRVRFLSLVRCSVCCGALLYVTLTDDAKIAVFERGYSYMGSYPEYLRETIRKSSFNPKVIKMAGDSWFFADATGSVYRYSM